MDDDKIEEKIEKTPAQIEREAIKVTSGAKEEVKEEIVEDEVEAKDDVDEIEDEADEAEKEEPKELTEEQKQIKALEKKLERAQRRAGKTAAERDENKKLVAELKASLEAKLNEGEQPLTEAEVNRRAKEMATNELTQREFDRAQEKLIEEATLIDKTFMSKVRDLAAEVAPLPEFFIGALNDIDNGGAVLNYLTDNPDDYEDLLKKNSPMKVMKGLLEISNKLFEAAKPKIKKISNAPEPAKALKGNNRNPDALPAKPTDNMAEYIRIRNAQDRAKREAQG
jgi:chromosome segregation ATPase